MKAIKWKKQHSNIIVVTLLSIAYVIVTVLVVIGQEDRELSFGIIIERDLHLLAQ